VVMTPVYCLEGAEKTKIAVSQEGLRQVCRQAEAELYRSEIYQRTLAELQRGLGEAAEGCQNLIKALGREAIRLALRQLVRQYRANATVTIEPAPATERPALALSPAPLSQPISDIHPNPPVQLPSTSVAVVTDTEPVAPEAPPQPITTSQPRTNRLRKWSRFEAASVIEQERECLLRQIGQDFKKVREARSLSLEQLHTRTWIPLHQLKALEAGQVDQLPEDIYVRGFIKRIGDALGLNGSEIAATIPVPERAKTVIPSWQRSVGSGRSLSPVHLYLGYAVLMAGAVSGLTWMSQQSASDSSKTVSPSEAEPEVIQPAQSADLSGVQQSNMQSSMTQPDVIPPEVLPF
jgi:cytoskeleton protein RodZ